MSGDSFSAVSLHLGEGVRVGCHTYPEKSPILFVDAGDVSLTVHVRSRGGVDDTDMANARALAEAAAIYLAEVERLSAEAAAPAKDAA